MAAEVLWQVKNAGGEQETKLLFALKTAAPGLLLIFNIFFFSNLHKI